MTRMHDSYTNLRQKNAWCQQQQQFKLYLHDYEDTVLQALRQRYN